MRGYGKQVFRTLRPLFEDLDRHSRAPRTTAGRLARGGALVLPPATGSVMSQNAIRTWLERAEYPLLRISEGAFSITSGADVLARALGAGARSVEVMLRDRGAVERHVLRLVPGITSAQISSRLLDLPDIPSLDLRGELAGLARQSVRGANLQVADLGVGAPFKVEAEDVRRFGLAGTRASRVAEFRARQIRSEAVGVLRARAEPPRMFDPERDVGESPDLFGRVQKTVETRSEQAGRGAENEAHEAEADTVQARHERLGIKRYKWISSRDERTRRRHRELDGRIFSWDDPPEADEGQFYHPGERNRCRCTPSPLVDDILAALEGE